MLETLKFFLFQIEFIFSHMQLEDYIDIALVAALLYVAFQALYQTRALQLLRGVIIFAIAGAVLFMILPQNTFGLLVQGLIIMGIIALPWLFQDELRRALTGLGRLGHRRVYSSSFDRFKEILISVTQKLAERGEGALIVLEGETPLEEIIQTGVQIQAETITPELLLSVFRRNSPLHDGAVILRGDQLIAASCILPVSTERSGRTRLGTRHRAALGLSIQVPDTLVVVVSEETRGISVALNGRLYRHLNEERLDRWFDRFQDHIAGNDRSSWDWIKGGGLKSSLINAALAAVLATLAWAAVSLRTNPPQEVFIGDVPLNMVSPDSNLVVMNQIPGIINSRIQTTFDKAGEISSASVSAVVNLEDLTAGVHRVPVEVTTEDERVQVVSVDPNFVDVTLEPFVSIEFAPTYSITDPETLPLGYKLGEISLSPGSISVKGPEQFVEQVNEVRTEIAIEGRKNSFQESQLVVPLDVDGQLINGVRLEPAEVLISVPVEQTEQTRQVPIYADIKADTIEDDYEINSVLISPPTVTLIGEELVVRQVGEFLATAPISLTNVFSEINLDVPLLLPEGIVSRGEADEDIITVRVDIQVSPVTNYLPLTTAPELRGMLEDYTAEVSPPQVSILLIGPQPILDEITSDPSLVVAYVDLTGLGPGLYELPLENENPSGISVELFPSEVQVTINEQQ